MYPFPQPPYLLLVAGLLAGISCGLAFQASLKQNVRGRSLQPEPIDRPLHRDGQLLLPFLGICSGICVFLAAGLEIFSMARWLAYAIALPLTGLMGALIWSQLGKLLLQLQQGGSQAIDLDSL